MRGNGEEYVVESLPAGVTRITSAGHRHAFLVEGVERAVLIGDGVAAEVAERYTSLPVVAVSGDVMDLGGRRLRVLHTPQGRCLGDEVNGILFAGDVLATGDVRVDDMAALHGAAMQLAQLTGRLDLVYVGNGERYAVDGRFVRRFAAALSIVWAELPDGPTPEPSHDRAGRPVRRFRYPDFDLLLPAA